MKPLPRVVAAALLIGLLPCVAAYSQLPLSVTVEPTVRLTKAQARTFSDSLEAIARQAPVTFVAEGEPLVGTLAEEKVKDLPYGDAPLSVVVEKLAAVYDYDTERKGSVFLLKKRYSDASDLPGITLEECQQSLRDVQHILSRFSPGLNPSFSQDPQIQELIRSLSEAQLQAMADEQTGLPVASLSPRQRALISKVAYYYYVQFPARDMPAVQAQFDCVLNKETTFGWSELHGLRLFGYEGPFATPRGVRVSFRPLSHPNQVFTQPSGGIGFKLSPVGAGSIAGETEADPTAPPPPGVVPKEIKKRPASTLSDVIVVINTRVGGMSKIVVDDALAAKPVTVVGGDSASPTQLLEAVAKVYGLRVRQEKDGTLTLMRRLWRIPTTAAGIPDALRHVIPEPLLRALHLDIRDRYYSPARNEIQETAAVQAERSERFHQTRAVPQALRVAAVRRLRTTLEPRLKATPNGRVPLEALDADERSALANALMADVLMPLQELMTRTLPDYVSRFDQVILRGGIKPDKAGVKKFSLSLSPPRVPGDHRPVSSAGFMGLDYFP